jgi:hypothetical protein
MGIISTFQPAQTQTNQEYFKLPFNEMYKVLSDTQTRSDINRGEAEAITEESFLNLPQDEAHAAEARKWLMDSVDGLTENYGEDPLKWTAGLQSLKKQVKRRFDPSYGDIGKMQKRYERVVSIQADVDERHKDNPELAAYLKNNIIVDPFETANSKVDYGVKPGKEVMYVPQKDVTEFFTKNLAQLEKTTLKWAGLSKYKTLNEYTDAYEHGKIDGNTHKQVMEYLYNLVPPEFYKSYYQQAKAYGATPEDAEQELIPLELDANGEVVTDNGYFGLNPKNTISQMIYGYGIGKSSATVTGGYMTVEDAMLKDELTARRKAAETDMKKQFFGYQTTGLVYQTKSPWGTSEGSVNNYIATSKANNDAIAKDLLSQIGLSDTIVEQIDADGLYNGQIVSINENGTPNIKVQGKTGEHYITGMTTEVYNEFKAKYDTNWYNQTLAERSLLEAKAAATKTFIDKYDMDINQTLEEKTKALPSITGYSKDDVFRIIRTSIEVDKALGSSGSGSSITQGGTYATGSLYKPYRDLYNANPEVMNEYLNTFKSNEKLINEYQDVITDNLAPNTKYSSVYTNDLGLDAAGQETAKKELTDMFQFGNAANFKAYSPNVAEQLTVDVALKRAGANFFGDNVGFDTELAGFQKSIASTPEGLDHWQLNYTITGKGDNKSTKSVSVLVPMSSVEGGLSAPVLEAIKNSPYARAARISTLAKIFDFQEFSPPDLPGIKILHDSNSDVVQINGVTMSMEEGISVVATEYAIKDVMRRYNQDYDTAVITYRELNKPEAIFNTGVGPTIPVATPVQQ